MQDDDLAGFLEGLAARGFEDIEVQAAGHRLAGRVFQVPGEVVVPRRAFPRGLNNLLPKDREQGQLEAGVPTQNHLELNRLTSGGNIGPCQYGKTGRLERRWSRNGILFFRNNHGLSAA